MGLISGLERTRLYSVLKRKRWFSILKRNLLYFLHVENKTFYLYETVPGAYKLMNEDAIKPRIDNFDFAVIKSIQQFKDLVQAGLKLSIEFPTDIYEIERKIKKGAFAFAIIVNSELAFIGFAATTSQAYSAISYYPYKVDFLNKEAYVGGAMTDPKYRNKGFFNYESYKRQQYLEENGITKTRIIVEVNNIASQKPKLKLGDRLYAKVKYLKIFGVQFWKETPVDTI